jgi:hypothetical protein
MKIELPNGSDRSNSNKESKKSKIQKPKKIGKKMPTEITWEDAEEEEFIKTYINFKMVKINTITFDIHLPNNFKMSNNSSLEEAKNKAVLLFN